MRSFKSITSEIHKKNILIMGTGPSIFYNINKVKEYIKEMNPFIIGINGYLFGLRKMQNEVGNISSLFPNLLISFLTHKEKFTPNGERKRFGEKYDLFRHFIFKQKKYIISNNIILLCPNNKSLKYKKEYGQAKWVNYSNYCEFPVWPRNYKKNKINFKFGDKVKYPNDFFCDGYITFKVNHGGEYVLAWVHSCTPSSIAYCGLSDFPASLMTVKERKPSHDAIYLRRGWFWSSYNKLAPRRMKTTQPKMLRMLSSYYGEKLVNLNLENKQKDIIQSQISTTCSQEKPTMCSQEKVSQKESKIKHGN